MTPELAIRAARAAFNRAIEQADLAAIGPILAPGAILVAGTDSAVISGRKAQLATWKQMFAAPSPTIFARTPETILVSPVEPIAFEQGRWQGTAADGSIEASGAYTAKWRNTGASWQIEAELYLTLA